MYGNPSDQWVLGGSQLVTHENQEERNITEYLRPTELAERWGCNPRTLANWRTAGRGPAYIKVGAMVRYSLTDVEAFEAQTRTEAVA